MNAGMYLFRNKVLFKREIVTAKICSNVTTYVPYVKGKPERMARDEIVSADTYTVDSTVANDIEAFRLYQFRFSIKEIDSKHKIYVIKYM